MRNRHSHCGRPSERQISRSHSVIANAPTACIQQRLERRLLTSAQVIAGDLPAARVSEFAQKAAENPAVTAGCFFPPSRQENGF